MEDVTNMEVIRKFVDANSRMAVLAPPEGEGKNFLAFSSWMWEPSGGGLRLSLCWPAEGISSGRIKK